MAVLPATTIVELTPVILGVVVSEAVIVCEPAVAKVALNVPTPFVSVALAGRAAALSVDVNATVPL